jgi:hypothetical protein
MFDLKAMDARLAEFQSFDLRKALESRVVLLREAAQDLPAPLGENLIREADATEAQAKVGE